MKETKVLKPENVVLGVCGLAVTVFVVFSITALTGSSDTRMQSNQQTQTELPVQQLSPSPLPTTTPTAKTHNEAQGRAYITDTYTRLTKASLAIKEVIETMKASAYTKKSEEYEWQARLDQALSNLSDEGYLLRQLPITVSSSGEKVDLPLSVERLRKKREALGIEMVEYTYDVREALPLLTEAPDRPGDPVKFKAATKRFGKVTRLFEETTQEWEKASKTE